MAFISAGGGAGGDNITYLAPNYDSTKTYNIGDVVIYKNLSYKCKNNDVTGAWNSAKWERTYLINEDEVIPEDAISFVAPEYDSTQTYNTDDVVLYQGLTYKCLEDSVTGTWDNEKWTREYICNLNSNLGSVLKFTLYASSGNTKSYVNNSYSGMFKLDNTHKFKKAKISNASVNVGVKYIVINGTQNNISYDTEYDINGKEFSIELYGNGNGNMYDIVKFDVALF